ncbi:ead/Ea22-like family protein [Escherichia coli]|uniref:ead/Ea22-like family protein n=2 Tax=Escherichia coli TaxID=562 RepID=UPI0030141AE7
MSEINSQALREAAEKAGEDKWQAKKINGDFFVIRHGSYTRQHGYTSYQPIAEIDCKPVRDFVAKANPATVLELLDELEAAKKRIAELEAEPVSQAYNLAELIEGMEVSIDVSTCDADLGNRYFGTVTEALELDTAKNGYILLVQDAEPNFDVNGNYPVTPDGWISCSERMPKETGDIIVVSDGIVMSGISYSRRDGFYIAALEYDDDEPIGGVTHWMPLPELPRLKEL